MGKIDAVKAAEAAEAKRKADLSADLERKDDTEIALYAAQIGVTVTADMKRPDIVAAIELKAEDDAKSAASAAAIKAMEDEEAAKISAEALGGDAASRVIRRINASFCADIPQEARAGGFEPEEDHERFGGSYDAPNGTYRVLGSEYLITIKGKRIARIEKATLQNNYGGKSVVAV